MSNILNIALKAAGLNARYESNAAKLLPISAELLETYPELKDAKIDGGVKAGDMIVTWRADSGKTKGAILDPLAQNDLTIMVRMTDGEDQRVDAQNMVSAIEGLARLQREDKANRKDLEAINERGEKEHRAGIRRGDIDADEAFQPVKPRFQDGAFANFDGLAGCVSLRLNAEYGNAFTGMPGKSLAALGELQLTKAIRDTLTPADLSRAKEAHALRAEIHQLTHAVPTVTPPAREHGDERVDAVLEGLRLSGEGHTMAQAAAQMPNAELVSLAFKPLTSAPVHEIKALRLSPREANTVLQDLRRFEETEWSDGAIGKTRSLLKDRMPGYDFQAKMFSRDHVDMMLVADHAGAVLYAWDVETRVVDFDASTEMKVFTAADVPTLEELEALRAQARDLRYDAGGGEIDFSFDDDEDADAEDVLEP